MSKRVPASGRTSARLVIVGESPGRDEVVRGKPFVGYSGSRLISWLNEVGLQRRDFYIDNLYQYRPPNNKLKDAKRSEVNMWASYLPTRIDRLDDPWIIIPTGMYPLRALMRRDLWHKDSPKIDDWRGSMIPYTTKDGRVIKMIPTIHPARTFRDPKLIKLCREDWARIAEESKTREIKFPSRKVYINDTQIYREYKEAASNPNTIMSIDIETNPSKRKIICVGFSFDPRHALVFTWGRHFQFIKRLCESPCRKALQNGYGYDVFWLDPPDYIQTDRRIKIRNYVFDDMAMDHSIDPILDHDLATQASRFTRWPFWKRMHKDQDTEVTKSYFKDSRSLLTYCGYDNIGQRALVDVHLRRMGE